MSNRALGFRQALYQVNRRTGGTEVIYGTTILTVNPSFLDLA